MCILVNHYSLSSPAPFSNYSGSPGVPFLYSVSSTFCSSPTELCSPTFCSEREQLRSVYVQLLHSAQLNSVPPPLVKTAFGGLALEEQQDGQTHVSLQESDLMPFPSLSMWEDTPSFFTLSIWNFLFLVDFYLYSDQSQPWENTNLFVLRVVL